uniref:Transcription initiation factor IIF subunit alpha n=2 Tax=Lygus hesperus TaxID=30085 RepID=A0A0A9W041_LYGHE
MSATSTPPQSVQEYSIRVPKNVRKKFQVMRFNSATNTDFTKWTQVKMERENNAREYQRFDEDQPKFGAGSEYGREAREEARRKKFGIITKKYKPDDQPWILKVNGKAGRKFKGIREGGVAENASYYVFTHAADGGIEAYPLCEWYNFQPIQRYKALSAEEAEQEFGRRNKVMNYFSLMMRKRLKNEEDAEGEEGEEGKPKKGKKSTDFKISEMDDWVDSDEETSEEEGEDGEKSEKEKKKKKKPGKEKTAKKKKGSDDSAEEESDDGDEEGRELDYISDSSDSESDHEGKAVKEQIGVAEERALRKLLTSDEDDEEEEEKKDEPKDEKKDGKDAEGKDPKDKTKDKDSNKRKRKKEAAKKKKSGDGSSSGSSGDSTDSEVEKATKEGGSNSASGSRSATPTTDKSKKGDSLSPAKKQRMDVQPPMLSYGGDNGITEEAVRRYLMRKPMTATELLQKFKGRKTGLSSDQLVNVMTQILKKINPVKQTIKNKMYLSIKPQ